MDQSNQAWQIQADNNLQRLRSGGDICRFVWTNKADWSEEVWQAWLQQLAAQGYQPLDATALHQAAEQERLNYPQRKAELEAQKVMFRTLEQTYHYVDALAILWEIQANGIWDNELQDWENKLQAKAQILSESRTQGLKIWRAGNDIRQALPYLKKAYELNPFDTEVAQAIRAVEEEPEQQQLQPTESVGSTQVHRPTSAHKKVTTAFRKTSRVDVQAQLEKNLERLSASGELRRFVWCQKGLWNDTDWQVWTKNLQVQGYYPLNEEALKQALLQEQAD